MSYFREVSDILYQSQQTKLSSSEDYVRVKNLFRRAKVRDDFAKSYNLFDRYKVVGEKRPEQIAEELYGSAQYDWVVLISNNIINLKNEWPLSNEEFNMYLNRKYTTQELQSVHHYETTKVLDSTGKTIISAGKLVDSDFTVSYYDKNQVVISTQISNFSSNTVKFSSSTLVFSDNSESITYGGMVTVNPVKPVTVHDYEIIKNQSKRLIYVLKPKYLQAVIDDFREIMSYGFSTQYMDDKTKKAENMRIIAV
jgi:hypothetical protein